MRYEWRHFARGVTCAEVTSEISAISCLARMSYQRRRLITIIIIIVIIIICRRRHDNEPWRPRDAMAFAFIRWRNWHWSSPGGSLKGRVAVRGGGPGWHWMFVVVGGRLRHTLVVLVRTHPLIVSVSAIPAQVRQRRVHRPGDLKAVTCNICQCKRTTQGWRSPPRHTAGACSLVIIYYKTAKRPRYL